MIDAQKTLLFFCLMLLGAFFASAQVGIDNPLPNPNAALDMKATDKGMLLPRMTTIQRMGIVNNCNPECPDGLLVYDSDIKGFFYMYDNQWYMFNPWDAPDVSIASNEDIMTNAVIVRNVGIGISPDDGYTLDVDGKVQIRNGADVTAGSMNIAAGSITTINGNIFSSGTGNISTTTGNISAGTGHLRANNFSSNINDVNCSGPVPKGGIVLWSGSPATIPAGWALCDGTNGTPDMRDRFIMGGGGGTPLYSTGGVASVSLTVDQMPAHSHGGTTDTTGNHRHIEGGAHEWEIYGFSGVALHRAQGGPDQGKRPYTDYAGEHTHDGESSYAGSGAPHENRPPYYALAFIMKL